MNALTPAERYRRVLDRAAELADLESAGALLAWDQETFMPKGGAGGRSSVSASLAGFIHEKLTDPVLVEDLETLAADGAGLDDEAAAQVKELKRLQDRARKVPGALVKEMAETQSRATAVWAKARADRDYPAFAPYLERIFGLKREMAEAVGYTEEPYEALLDEYEPGARVSAVAETLNALREFLIPLVRDIAESGVKPDALILQGPYETAGQDRFGREVVAAMGFDMETGRLDISEHPFTSGIHSGDVRLTTRYKPDLSVGLFGTMHEAGHGLYEQNLPAQWRRTPLGTSTSLGLHESQSRLWENQVGRGRAFWTRWYPRLQEIFPGNLKGVSLDDFYLAVNGVRPSFIRIEADEVTYNLHIVLRFEIERGLLSGELDARNLPEIWNTRFQEYLGLTPPSPDLGVMQDIHWASGYIGYFPTYSLGNLYSAQLFAAAERAIPDLEGKIAAGEMLPLRDWLIENVHRWGRRLSAAEVVERASGKPASAEDFNRYLREKYSPLYKLG